MSEIIKRNACVFIEYTYNYSGIWAQLGAAFSYILSLIQNCTYKNISPVAKIILGSITNLKDLQSVILVKIFPGIPSY